MGINIPVTAEEVAEFRRLNDRHNEAVLARRQWFRDNPGERLPGELQREGDMEASLDSYIVSLVYGYLYAAAYPEGK